MEKAFDTIKHKYVIKILGYQGAKDCLLHNYNIY